MDAALRSAKYLAAAHQFRRPCRLPMAADLLEPSCAGGLHVAGGQPHTRRGGGGHHVQLELGRREGGLAAAAGSQVRRRAATRAGARSSDTGVGQSSL